MTTKDILSLPEELLLVIFKKLSAKDLCNVVLVSHYFNKIGTQPSLWADVAINKRKLVTSSWENALTVFDIPRYKRSILDLSHCYVNSPYKMSPLRMIDILRRTVKSDISHINLRDVNLVKIPRGLLGEVVSRATKANLSNCRGLRPSKLLSLFTSCSESTTLKELHLGKVDLLEVPTDLLTKTIKRLEIVTIVSCDCSGSEKSRMLKEAILAGIVNSKTLKTVNLTGELSPEDRDRLLSETPLSMDIYPNDCACGLRDKLNMIFGGL